MKQQEKTEQFFGPKTDARQITDKSNPVSTMYLSNNTAVKSSVKLLPSKHNQSQIIDTGEASILK